MNKLYQQKEWLEEKFKTIKYAQRIGKECGVTGDTIEYWRKKFNIPKYEFNKCSARKYQINENYFKIIDSEEKAYWLGFIMADGYIERHNNKPYRLGIMLKQSDSHHLEKFKQAIGSNKEIIFRDIYDPRGFISHSAVLRINSLNLCSDLEKLSITSGKTGYECIPNIESKYTWSFLRGYFDGDGWISKEEHNYKIGICTASKVLTDQITNFFKTNNIDIHWTNRKDNGNDFYVFESRCHDKNISILHGLYDNASTYLDRKYQLAIRNLESAHNS